MRKSPHKLDSRRARMLFLVALYATLSGPATAEYLRARLDAAAAQLQRGDAVGALQAYQDLLADYPDAAEVSFGAACAWYRIAEQALAAAQAESAVQGFEEARAAFDPLRQSRDARIRREAAFNAANSVAQTALIAEQAAQPQEAVAALRKAAAAYESVLREHPGHAGAQQNLDHVRYRLKLLLQQPKQEQEQQQQEQPPQEQPELFSVFLEAETELHGACVEIHPDGAMVELVPEKGSQP